MKFRDNFLSAWTATADCFIDHRTADLVEHTVADPVAF